MLLEPDTPELGGETILVGTRVMLRIEAGGAKHGLLGTVVWASGRGKGPDL